jgi:DNA (cytosine-5)-methyltransferase 1
VVAAIEVDPAACASFRANHVPGCHLVAEDIRRVDCAALAAMLELEDGRLDLLTACPPCQPFSTLGTGNPEDPRNGLVGVIARFVDALAPRLIVLENVPGLASQPALRKLLCELADRYGFAQHLVQAADFGVPQSRRRIIVFGVALDIGTAPTGNFAELVPDDFDRSARTAGQALADVEGLTYEADPVHRARTPRPLTVRRLRATTPGGGRRELPPELVLNCHKTLARADATSIYGRVDPGAPAPTMTTRCTTPSCGRFGHPTEDRGLTLREAALLQTFPIDYRFAGTYGEIERQIGNAVPARLAQAVGLAVRAVLATALQPAAS